MLDQEDYARLSEFLIERGLVETEKALKQETHKFTIHANTNTSVSVPYDTPLSTLTTLPCSFWSMPNPQVSGVNLVGNVPTTSPASSSGLGLGFRTKSLPASPAHSLQGAGKVPYSAPGSLRGSSGDLSIGGVSMYMDDKLEKSNLMRSRKSPGFQVRPIMDKRLFQSTELQLEESTDESLKNLARQPSPFTPQILNSVHEASPATSRKSGEHGSERGLSPVFELMPPVVPEVLETKDSIEEEEGADADNPNQLSRVGSLSESTQEVMDSIQTCSDQQIESEHCDHNVKDSTNSVHESSFHFCLGTDPGSTPASTSSHAKHIISGFDNTIRTLRSQEQKSGDDEGGFSFPLTPRSEDENEPIFATWQSFHSKCSGDASVSSLARAFSIDGAPSSTGDGPCKEDVFPNLGKPCASHLDEWEVMLAHKSKHVKEETKAKDGFLLSTGGSMQTGADPSICASSEVGACEFEPSGTYLDACQVYPYSEEYVNDRYDIIDLKIYHKRGVTGFESSKELHMEQGDVVAGRYQVVSVVGTAAFSQAVEAYDLKEQRPVCLKMVKNNKDFFDQSLDEIKLLRFVNARDPSDEKGVVRMYHFFYYKEHLFLVFELLHSNLYEVQRNCLKSRSEPYFFTMKRIQSIASQVLSSLAFLHGLNIIHSDLKPENILMKSMEKCQVKVIDLGSSCFATDYLGSYVQSRSYRAPEVILGLSYDHKVDIWSLGCVLAELAAGYVLFQSNSLASLLARVESCRGPIPKDMILDGSNSHKYFTASGRVFHETSTHDYEILIPTPVTLEECIPGVDAGFIEFLSMLLTVDSRDRPTAVEALQHAWLQHDYGTGSKPWRHGH